MIKKIINKIQKKLALAKAGVLPANWFDEFYKNPPVSPAAYNRPVWSNEAANQWLFDSIRSGKSFFASRFGSFELGMLNNFLFNRITGGPHWSSRSLEMLARDHSWNGAVAQQERFYDGFLRSVPAIDGLGIWYNHGEETMANYFCPGAVLFELLAYEPYFYDRPWTMALENKKVLVIHPYTSSIPQQYAKRELLFNKPVLPSFELITYQPFSSYGDDWRNYADMQATVEKMVTDIQQIDFDVALIAAGPQGLPLGAAIKQMNKQAIHVGGALQLFFGILGKRWEEPGRPQAAFFNQHWIRPHATEIPVDPRAHKFSDAGCYW